MRLVFRVLIIYVYCHLLAMYCLQISNDPSKWQVEYLKTLQLYYSLRLVYGHAIIINIISIMLFLILDRSCEVDEHKHGSLVRLGTRM